MQKRFIGLIALLAVFLIASVGISFAASDGSVSQGNLSVYKNGQLSKKLTGMSPVEEGSMLICDGKCMIKSNGVSIMAEDRAELAITNNEGLFNLYVRRGHVEFVISERAKQIAFHTPEGAYSVADVMFNASNDPVVRGYMLVDNSGTKVGVREGRMIFATDTGVKAVKANEHIILAMSDVKKKEAAAISQGVGKKKAAAIIPAAGGSSAVAPSGTILGMSTGYAIATGVVVTAAAVGIGVAANNSGGGGGTVVSPAQ